MRRLRYVELTKGNYDPATSKAGVFSKRTEFAAPDYGLTLHDNGWVEIATGSDAVLIARERVGYALPLVERTEDAQICAPTEPPSLATPTDSATERPKRRRKVRDEQAD